LLFTCHSGLLGPANDSSIATEAEDGCGFVQNSYGARVSWKSHLPVRIQVDPQWPIEFFESAVRAADKWNSTVGSKLIELEKLPQGAEADPLQDVISGLYWRTEWSSEKNNQQAVTTLFYRGNQINEGDVKVNAKDFEFFVNDPNSNRQVHMESLLLHEFGHLMGLRHATLWPTVMWSTLASSTRRDVISEKDLESMKCEY